MPFSNNCLNAPITLAHVFTDIVHGEIRLAVGAFVFGIWLQGVVHVSDTTHPLNFGSNQVLPEAFLGFYAGPNFSAFRQYCRAKNL